VLPRAGAVSYSSLLARCVLPLPGRRGLQLILGRIDSDDIAAVRVLGELESAIADGDILARPCQGSRRHRL